MPSTSGVGQTRLPIAGGRIPGGAEIALLRCAWVAYERTREEPAICSTKDRIRRFGGKAHESFVGTTAVRSCRSRIWRHASRFAYRSSSARTGGTRRLRPQ